MTALNVRHVGIVTNDLKKSINFYSKILGFKIVRQMNETDPSLSNLMSLKKVSANQPKNFEFNSNTKKIASKNQDQVYKTWNKTKE